MTRPELLEAYLKGPDLVEQKLTEIPAEAFHFMPSTDAWSIHEIIIHLPDSDTNSFIRCRKIVAEPGSTITAYDQDCWAEVLKYRERSISNALNLLKALRVSTHELLVTLPEDAWQRHIDHPELGHYTLSQWLQTYVDHITGHLGQIDRNLAAWEKAGKPVTG